MNVNAVEIAVEGVIAKAAKIARKHGHFAYGHEAKVLAEFIAHDIEHITDDVGGWEEREALRASERGRQDREG